MRKFGLFFLLLFCSTHIFAASFNRIIFFGDSLTDDGNLYALLLNAFPKSPPYYKGRFSNGPTWAEKMGKYYYSQKFIDYKIYAYGGATAEFHLPTDKFISPTNLDLEIDKYLMDMLFRDKSKALYTIWIGGNDYLYYFNSVNAEVFTNGVVSKTVSAIQKLINNGAKNFLIFNLPDLSKIPYARAAGIVEKVKLLVEKHNQKLANSMQVLQAKYPELNFVFIDIYSMFNDIVANPAKYNKKYNANIINTVDACWLGHYYYNYNVKSAEVKKAFQQAVASSSHTDMRDNYDIDAMTAVVMNSPALLETYKAAQAMEDKTVVPCDNPSGYLFWDTIHPSAAAHRILAKVIVETLSAQAIYPA